MFDSVLICFLKLRKIFFDIIEVKFVGGFVLLHLLLGRFMDLQYLHLNLVLFLIEGDQIIPDPLGRAILHSLYTI